MCIGYARVSTDDQTLDLQHDAPGAFDLRAACRSLRYIDGCRPLHGFNGVRWQVDYFNRSIAGAAMVARGPNAYADRSGLCRVLDFTEIESVDSDFTLLTYSGNSFPRFD